MLVSGGPVLWNSFAYGFTCCGWGKGDQEGGTGGPSEDAAVTRLATRRGVWEGEVRIEESEEQMRRVEFIAV